MFLNFFIPRLNSAILEPYSLLYFEKLTERFGKCRTRPYFRYRYAILKHIPPRSEAEGCGICAQNCVTIAEKYRTKKKGGRYLPPKSQNSRGASLRNVKNTLSKDVTRTKKFLMIDFFPILRFCKTLHNNAVTEPVTLL